MPSRRATETFPNEQEAKKFARAKLAETLHVTLQGDQPAQGGVRSEWQVSIRRACKALEFDRSAYHYKSRRSGQAALEQRIKEICHVRVRYGYRRIHVVLRREGWRHGQNKTRRVYRELGLQLRRVKAVLTGAWRNYAMCVADSVVAPVNDPKGGPVVCFNPYLEPGLSGGISSNCMSCHARATAPGVRYPTTYHPNGWIDPADQIFAAQTKTDFVWAVQNSGFSQ